MFTWIAQCSVETWCAIGLGVVAVLCYGGLVVGIAKFCAGATGKGWDDL